MAKNRTAKKVKSLNKTKNKYNAEAGRDNKISANPTLSNSCQSAGDTDNDLKDCN